MTNGLGLSLKLSNENDINTDVMPHAMNGRYWPLILDSVLSRPFSSAAAQSRLFEIGTLFRFERV
ncbi:unnamed protein product [Fusarium graminearum]|nr:unnamed protein product [Fusarium graminearum]CAG1975691.1 unnamed protein product [Fusarium graminearum]